MKSGDGMLVVSVAPRVLVVEEDEVMAVDLKLRLERIGCEVVAVAYNGVDALAMAALQRPTLVFIGTAIHGHIDGIETAAQLTRRMDVPIVFLTSQADDATIQRANQVGPYGYLIKPLEDRELHMTIEIALYRHQKEARARSSHHALANASIGIFIVDAQHAELEIVECNVALARMTGYTEEELCGRSAGFLLGDNTDPVDAENFLRSLSSEEECNLPLQLHRRDGTPFWCDLSLSLVRDPGGTVTHFLCFHSDVTARRQTQEALPQSTTLEANALLTAGIVHDFNNSLTLIRAYAGFVRDALPEVDTRRDDIDELLRATDTATGLTGQLLTFSRQQPTEKRPIDINRSIAVCLKMVRTSVGQKVTVGSTPSPHPAMVCMDPVQIDQILLNLALNARDAMPDGGQLTFEVSVSPAKAAAAVGQAFVRLEVSDTGDGMERETMARVFEPFFTTKAAGKGTGLGLASCLAIVEDAGGRINIESLVGKGTTFIIEIPAYVQPLVSNFSQILAT
jgi:PAS domain S-box-containing protein